jgi:uncharacterized protein involved in tolerance to divalent cations
MNGNDPADIRKKEIPDKIFESYAQALANHNIPKFWGAFISYLIDAKNELDSSYLKQEEITEKLEQELEIRTKEHKENKITEAILALQDAGYEPELLFRKKK